MNVTRTRQKYNTVYLVEVLNAACQIYSTRACSKIRTAAQQIASDLAAAGFSWRIVTVKGTIVQTWVSK